MLTRVTTSVRIGRDDAHYPTRVADALGIDAPPAFRAFGNLSLLQLRLLGFHSSILTPPELVLRSLELARTLRNQGVPVVGGFQSPIERECLALLLRGSQPLVIVLARDIERMRVPVKWRDALRADRLLIVSPAVRPRRPTIRTAMQRNRFVAALADRLLVVHGRAGSRTYRTAACGIEWGREVFCFEHRRNLDLILLGAKPVELARVLGTST
jgi:predicted Rossmann fold nucleotide-binding protein DprA/Smf involved in DNA uptake